MNTRMSQQVRPAQQLTPAGVGVLLIDMQPHFLNLVAVKERSSLIAHQQTILGLCILNHIPVFNVTYDGYGATLPELSQYFNRGRHWNISKPYTDAFQKTGLHALLQVDGVEELVVTGLFAGGCVRQTTASALDLGYSVYTSDALIGVVEGLNESDRERCLKWYADRGCLGQLPAPFTA